MRRIIIGIIGFLVLASLFLVLCTYRARKYENVVLVRFGNIVESPTPIIPGFNWYYCFPTDKVVKIDTRLHIQQSELVEMPMSGEPISVRTFAAWHIKDPRAFYRAFSGSDADAENFLNSQVRGETQKVLTRHKFDEIFNAGPAVDENAAAAAATAPFTVGEAQTRKIEADITASVNVDLAGLGMEVTEVGFSRFAFSATSSDITYQRMSTERQRLAKHYLDDGDTEAKGLIAQADSDAAIIESSANLKAAQIRADAEKNALTIIADMQKQPFAQDFYEFLRSLDLWKAGVNKQTILIFTADDPFMRFFRPGSLVPAPATQNGGVK